jgi:hypothetical protein
MTMRQPDYTDENGNQVYELGHGHDVFHRPDGSWYESTLTDEAMIEASEAMALIDACTNA